jgi:pyruvate formate lyase activating enzyme
MRCELTGVAGFHKTSFIDFPGTVATVLFFSGCNLRCPYCHNPHVVNAQQSEEIDSSEIWSFLEKRQKTIDGVVFSGGEPTLHACCSSASAAMRDLGFRVKLDTNGLLPDMIGKIAPEYLALDVKTLPRHYKTYCASPYDDTAERLARSLAIVKSMGTNAEVRITCAPGFVTREVMSELVPLIAGVSRVFLQPLQNKVQLLDPEFAEKPLIPQEEIEQFREILAPHVGRCDIRGS